MNKAFEGNVVIVTGANSGIGEAAALAFQEGGSERLRIRSTQGCRWSRAGEASEDPVDDRRRRKRGAG